MFALHRARIAQEFPISSYFPSGERYYVCANMPTFAYSDDRGSFYGVFLACFFACAIKSLSIYYYGIFCAYRLMCACVCVTHQFQAECSELVEHITPIHTAIKCPNLLLSMLPSPLDPPRSVASTCSAYNVDAVNSLIIYLLRQSIYYSTGCI